MSVANKLIDYGSKFILVGIGLAVALLPILHLAANETLHHQSWEVGFEKYEDRLQEIDQVLGLEVGYLHLRNFTGKITGSDYKETLRFADYVCYHLQKQGSAVVRKNLEYKIKRKAKKGQESQSNTEGNSVTSLVEVPALAFLRKEVAKFIDFEHQSLKRKHWVVVSFGALQDKIKDQIQIIKEKNSEYKFTIITPQKINVQPQKQSAKPKDSQPQSSSPKQKQNNGKGKKPTKVKKVRVVEEQLHQPSDPKPKEQKDKQSGIQTNDL